MRLAFVGSRAGQAFVPNGVTEKAQEERCVSDSFGPLFSSRLGRRRTCYPRGPAAVQPPAVKSPPLQAFGAWSCTPHHLSSHGRKSVHPGEDSKARSPGRCAVARGAQQRCRRTRTPAACERHLLGAVASLSCTGANACCVQLQESRSVPSARPLCLACWPAGPADRPSAQRFQLCRQPHALPRKHR